MWPPAQAAHGQPSSIGSVDVYTRLAASIEAVTPEAVAGVARRMLRHLAGGVLEALHVGQQRGRECGRKHQRQRAVQVGARDAHG